MTVKSLISKFVPVIFIKTLDPQVMPVSRALRDGGKPAAARLLKPVKVNCKRADFLRWFFEKPRTVEETMNRFGISRQNVFSYWTAITREHGIGYALSQNMIRAILPAYSTPDSVFRKDSSDKVRRPANLSVEEKAQKKRMYQANYYRAVTLPNRTLARSPHIKLSPEERRQRDIEYAKKWKKMNPKKVRAYQKKYSANLSLEEKAARAERFRQWQKLNPEKVRAYQKKYWANLSAEKRTKKAECAKWYRANLSPEKKAKIAAKRALRALASLPTINESRTELTKLANELHLKLGID